MTMEVGQENIPRLELTFTSLREYKRMSPHSFKQILNLKIKNHRESHDFWGLFTIYSLQFYIHLGPKTPLDKS
jgi:hypothetical protein